VTARAKWYLAIVIAAGLIAALGGLRLAAGEPALDWPHTVLLLSLAAFAGLLVFLRLVRPTRQATSGVSTLVLFGALLLTAPETVVLVLAVIAADIACRPRNQRPPWFVIGFNTAQLLLAALAAHAVNQLLHAQFGHLGNGSSAEVVLDALPAVVVFAIVNYGLLWGVHRFVTAFDGGFVRVLAAEGVEEASLLMIAALARAAWAVQPWFVLLACGPLVFFWRLYRTVGRLESTNAKLVETQSQAIDGLVQALAARDNEVSGHSDRVAYSTSLLARQIGIDPASDEYEVIVRGALLHDVGKIAVRDAILHKQGSLTDDEWVEMRDHAIQGYKLVETYPFLAAPAQIVLAHHERWDGKGYPRGLAGDEIPIGARLFAVADTFDAITAARPYRPPRTRAEAAAEIVLCGGSQFDPRVVECFLAVGEQFPVAVPDIVPRLDAARSA